MALRGSRIENFDRIWCLGPSGGLDFCVSPTNFQKSDRLASTAFNKKVAKIQPDIS